MVVDNSSRSIEGYQFFGSYPAMRYYIYQQAATRGQWCTAYAYEWAGGSFRRVWKYTLNENLELSRSPSES